MNSEPLSESIPRIGKGKTRRACSIASVTQIAALFGTERFTVQPVATSVIVRVKQNSPKEFPPSWPTRSISTKPGRASSHSDQVRIGIWDLSSDPGLVWLRPRNCGEDLGTSEPAVDRRRAHLSEQLRLGVGEVELAVSAQQRHEDREHRREALAGRRPGDPPAQLEGRDRPGRSRRGERGRRTARRGSHRRRAAAPARGPGASR